MLSELRSRHFGWEDSPTLVWQATAAEMNPTLPADYLARMAEDDPEAYRREVLGEFSAGVAQLFDPEALDAIVLRGERERLPGETVTYTAGCDAASGTGSDAFTVAVAHRAADGVAMLDALRVWKPPFSPEVVLAEAAASLRRYRVAEVEGDSYAPNFVAEGFQRHGIRYVGAVRTRSEFYLELLPLVKTRLAAIHDHLQDLAAADAEIQRRAVEAAATARARLAAFEAVEIPAGAAEVDADLAAAARSIARLLALLGQAAALRDRLAITSRTRTDTLALEGAVTWALRDVFGHAARAPHLHRFRQPLATLLAPPAPPAPAAAEQAPA
jgi:hypothetical protein